MQGIKEGIKLGVVPYINVLPLIYELKDKYSLLEGTPSELARLYSDGKLDLALLPIYEVLNNRACNIIDGVSISAENRSGSVLCFQNKRLKQIKHVALDKSSLSALHLLKLILKQYYNLQCEYSIESSKYIISNRKHYDAYLLIGDNAIHHKEENSKYFDLSSIWREWTGYPFVFAVWVSTIKDNKLREDILKSRDEGLKNIDKVVEQQKNEDKDFLYYYYSKNISFNLDEKKKQAITLYQNMLYKENYIHKLLSLNYY